MPPVASVAPDRGLADPSHDVRTDQMMTAAPPFIKDCGHHGMTMKTGRKPADKVPA
jgi:hypothetical protein